MSKTNVIVFASGVTGSSNGSCIKASTSTNVTIKKYHKGSLPVRYAFITLPVANGFLISAMLSPGKNFGNDCTSMMVFFYSEMNQPVQSAVT